MCVEENTWVGTAIHSRWDSPWDKQVMPVLGVTLLPAVPRVITCTWFEVDGYGQGTGARSSHGPDVGKYAFY